MTKKQPPSLADCVATTDHVALTRRIPARTTTCLCDGCHTTDPADFPLNADPKTATQCIYCLAAAHYERLAKSLNGQADRKDD
jgi:hypothetical protein